MGVKVLCKKIQKLSFSGTHGEDWGYDFKCQFPYVWWKYNYNLYKYLKYEFLLWGLHEDDIRPKISPTGLQ